MPSESSLRIVALRAAITGSRRPTRALGSAQSSAPGGVRHLTGWTPCQRGDRLVQDRTASADPRTAPNRRWLPVRERYRDLLAAATSASRSRWARARTPLIHARRLGAELGLDEPLPQVRGNESHRLVQGSRHGPGGESRRCRAVRGQWCAPRPATRRHRLPPTPRRPACPATSSCRRARSRAASSPRHWPPGARLVMVDGNFDAALAAVRRLGEEGAAVGRQLDQPGPARRAADGGLGDRRRPRTRAGRRWPCRSATPGTSPPIGRGFRRATLM